MAMITRAEQPLWPGDHPIEDLETAGPPTNCLVRLKLFTLDQRRVIRQTGVLGRADQKNLRLA